MRRTLLCVCAVCSLVMVPAAHSAQDMGPTASAPIEDRLSQDRMAELVSAPMSVARREGLAAGKAAFERLVADARTGHGAQSIQVADLIMAFGVNVYSFGFDEDDRRIKGEAIPYLEAAIAAYRAVLGDAHPEVSVALNSYADAQTALNEANPPASVDPAREESYRITLAAYGPASLETLARLRYLAVLRGHPSRTQGDPARIEAAAALFRELISRSPNRAGIDYLSAPGARSALARMYAQNRMANEAREQLRLAIAQAGSWGREDQCFFDAVESPRVEAILAGRDPGQPNILSAALGAPARCFDQEDGPTEE